VVLAPERLYVSGEFIVMMPSATLDSLFLKHLLMSPRFLAFTALLDTGDRPRVSWEKIANFEFQLPELALQKQIVERIESSLVVAGSLHADLEQLGSQIATLRRALLHSAFSGNMRNG
jgi:type I restriction enzyme S subunit